MSGTLRDLEAANGGLWFEAGGKAARRACAEPSSSGNSGGAQPGQEVGGGPQPISQGAWFQAVGGCFGKDLGAETKGSALAGVAVGASVGVLGLVQASV